MTEPFSATLAAVAAANHVATAGRNARSLGTFIGQLWNPDSRWLPVSIGSASLTAKEAEDIDSFLKSPTAAPLLQIAWVYEYLDGRGSSLPLADTFKSTADEWCRDSKCKWSKHAAAIWAALQDRLAATVPKSQNPSVRAELDSASYLIGALDDRHNRSTFTTKLLDLAGNMTRLISSHTVGDAIAEINRSAMEVNLTHLDLGDEPVAHDTLYVDRTLESQDAEITTKWLTDGSLKRLVILGNPGAGKSTLCRHLTRISAHDVNSTPYVMISCKEYAATHWDNSLADSLWKNLHASGLGGDLEALKGCLLLGRIGVIFDAVDEVTQLTRRQELVERINSFAALYPFTSVVVTAREVDYNRTPLSRSLFERMVLREFTSEQVVEYVNRWFRSANRVHLAKPFLKESGKIQDIARNPLLLSLLCNVYRARGHIPTNRHSVYSQCADLLYKKWDSHRQIASNEDMPDYGSKLMESIAHFFWSTPSAGQAEEGQLEKIIATELEQLGAASSDASTSRARSFLEFSKGRLWLLTRSGMTSRGVPTYEFAHRTFQDYFTAEYLAKRAKDERHIAGTILECFKQDPGSTLPELLFQSYDSKRAPGAAAVYRVITTFGEVELNLRLLNSNIPASRRELGFRSLMDRLRNGPRLSLSTFEALVSLHEEPRRQFLEAFLLAEGSEESRMRMAELWCEFVLRSDFQDHDSPWYAVYDELEAALPTAPASHSYQWQEARALQTVLALRGKADIGQVPLAPLLFAPSFGDFTWGVAFHCLLADSSVQVTAGQRRALFENLGQRWNSGTQFRPPAESAFAGLGPLAVAGSADLDVEDVAPALGLICIGHELGLSMSWITAPLSKHIDASSILVTRDAVRAGGLPPVDVRHAAVNSLKRLPEWAQLWTRNMKDLTLPPLRVRVSRQENFRGDVIRPRRPRASNAQN